jgi:cytochrome subunit of sulfide dehydrogenase
MTKMHIKTPGTRLAVGHFAPASATRAAPCARRAVVATAVCAALATVIAVPAASAQASAQDEQSLRTRALAATCAQCHGTDGRAEQREAFARLAGQSSDYLLTQLLAFRSGQRPATIMHQITKGYSTAQLETLAVYFSQQK